MRFCTQRQVKVYPKFKQTNGCKYIMTTLKSMHGQQKRSDFYERSSTANDKTKVNCTDLLVCHIGVVAPFHMTARTRSSLAHLTEEEWPESLSPHRGCPHSRMPKASADSNHPLRSDGQGGRCLYQPTSSIVKGCPPRNVGEQWEACGDTHLHWTFSQENQQRQRNGRQAPESCVRVAGTISSAGWCCSALKQRQLQTSEHSRHKKGGGLQTIETVPPLKKPQNESWS